MPSPHLTEAQRRILIVYASRGSDPRIRMEWYPLDRRVLADFVGKGWVTITSAQPPAWAITPAGALEASRRCAVPRYDEIFREGTKWLGEK